MSSLSDSRPEFANPESGLRACYQHISVGSGSVSRSGTQRLTSPGEDLKMREPRPELLHARKGQVGPRSREALPFQLTTVPTNPCCLARCAPLCHLPGPVRRVGLQSPVH